MQIGTLTSYFFENETLRKNDLVSKSLTVLAKSLKKEWCTHAELRHNTQISSLEIQVICSLFDRVKLFQSKLENGKLKFKTDLSILEQSEIEIKKRFAETIVNTEFLSSKVTEIIKKANLSSVLEEERKLVKVQQRYRRSLIDNPETVASYGAQKALESGSLEKKTALELHEAKECDALSCRFCLLQNGT